MTKVKLILNVNGETRQVTTDPEEPLLWVLRDQLRLTGTKFGCGEAICGACSVLVDHQAWRSCAIPVEAVANGEKITTIEGIGVPGRLSPLQRAFSEHTAFGCGFCTPGMIINATALLHANPHPSRIEIIATMDENLCRCGAYPAIIDASESMAACNQKE